jgi:4-methylaminobutanoate oxidase (formaldehyde-forming)
MAAHVHEVLDAAGKEFGLADAGYYAIDSLRIEKGYRAWGRELSPDVNPVEAGLGFAVKLGKGIDFRGREAVEKAKSAGTKKRLVSLTLADPGVMAWGSELVLRDGKPVGQVSSAAFGHTVGSVVALAHVANADGATDAQFVGSGRFQVDVAGTHCDARASFKAPYDPDAKRIR